MRSTDRRGFRALLLISVIAAILFGVFWFRSPSGVRLAEARETAGTPDTIPPEGYCFNDTKGEVPGNPERAVRAMELLYQKMLVYKRLHGRFPNNDIRPRLAEDMMKNTQEYGLDNPRQASLLFRNPDMKNADLYRTFPEPVAVDPFLRPGKRPDGKPVGAPKPAGTRDVLAFSNIYFFRNECVFPDHRITRNPVGFYLVLWEDGQVEKVPHDQVRYTYPQPGPFAECFPGQAGVPMQTFAYVDYIQQVKPLDSNNQIPASTKGIATR